MEREEKKKNIKGYQLTTLEVECFSKIYNMISVNKNDFHDILSTRSTGENGFKTNKKYIKGPQAQSLEVWRFPKIYSFLEC